MQPFGSHAMRGMRSICSVPQSSRPVTFASLAVRNYRVYASGAIVSNVGTWMQRVAQDWLVWQLTGSALAVGLATMAQFLPALLLSYPGGMVADRWNRRAALLVSQVHMAVPSALIGTMAVMSALPAPALFGLILWFGCASAMDAPLRHSFVADLVPNSLLPNAVGLNSASFNSAQLVGPAIGGLLISALGSGVQAAGWVVLGNCLSYVASACAIWRLDTSRFVDRRHAGPSAAVIPGATNSMSQHQISATLIALTAVGVFGLTFRPTNVLMTTVTFTSGAAVFGLLNSLLAVGSLCGAALSARSSDVSVRRLCVAAGALGAASVCAAVSPSLHWYALTLLPLGYLSQTSTNPAFALLQILVSEDRRGRIAAVAMTCLMGGMAVSAPLFGVLADQTNPRLCLLVGGIGAIGGALAAYGWYRRRIRP